MFFSKPEKLSYEVLNGHRRYVTHPTGSDAFAVACHSGDGTVTLSVRVSAAARVYVSVSVRISPFHVLCHSDFCAI